LNCRLHREIWMNSIYIRQNCEKAMIFRENLQFWWLTRTDWRLFANRHNWMSCALVHKRTDRWGKYEPNIVVISQKLLRALQVSAIRPPLTKNCRKSRSLTANKHTKCIRLEIVRFERRFRSCESCFETATSKAYVTEECIKVLTLHVIVF